MPNREQRRNGDLSEFEKMGFRVTTHTARGTEPYEIQLANMSAQDELDFHQATGLTFFEAFGNMSTYVLAAFVWLERRKYEKKLTFTEVAKEVKFRDLETMEFIGTRTTRRPRFRNRPSTVRTRNPQAGPPRRPPWARLRLRA